tara:strand:- start:287 stop:733 length:447 start_codon:yes stop_codon:yes gene_type:complete
MATAFDELIDRLKRVEIELSKTLVTVINDNNKELEDAQRNQMSVGKNALDKNIGRLRNQRYASIKKARGGKAPKNIADLKNKGGFYRGIKASANQTTFTLTSTDSKKDLLIQKYTNEIFGYSSKTFTLVKDEILVPGMITDIRKQLNI